jgi:hypothetical protein
VKRLPSGRPRRAGAAVVRALGGRGGVGNVDGGAMGPHPGAMALGCQPAQCTNGGAGQPASARTAVLWWAMSVSSTDHEAAASSKPPCHRHRDASYDQTGPRAFGVSLVLMLVRPAEATLGGSRDCPCADLRSGMRAFLTDDNRSLVVRTPERFLYPVDYGLSCRAHDQGMLPFCNSTTSDAWCADSWCFV